MEMALVLILLKTLKTGNLAEQYLEGLSAGMMKAEWKTHCGGRCFMASNI